MPIAGEFRDEITPGLLRVARLKVKRNRTKGYLDLVVRKLRNNRKLWEGTAAGLGLSEWLRRDLNQAYRGFNAVYWQWTLVQRPRKP